MRIKRFLLNGFIMACVWVQMDANLAPSCSHRIQAWLAPYAHHWLMAEASTQIQRLTRPYRTFAQAGGLLTVWRMYTPTMTDRWTASYAALYADGTERLLPLPSQIPRTMWQRNFIDFREDEFQFSLMYFTHHNVGYPLYAQHLCRRYGRDRPITAIKVTIRSWDMYPLAHAKRLGRYVAETPDLSSKIFPCRGR